MILDFFVLVVLVVVVLVVVLVAVVVASIFIASAHAEDGQQSKATLASCTNNPPLLCLSLRRC